MDEEIVWHHLNRGAIIVTLATGIPAFLALFGATDLSVVVLFSISFVAGCISLYGVRKLKRELGSKSSALDHLLRSARQFGADMRTLTSTELKIQDRVMAEKDSLLRLVSSAKLAISEIIGSTAKVTVYLLTREGGDYFVHPFVTSSREPLEQRFNLADRKLFVAALNPNTDPSEAQYRSARQDDKAPSGCCVVPIKPVENGREIIGFLSIDYQGTSEPVLASMAEYYGFVAGAICGQARQIDAEQIVAADIDPPPIFAAAKTGVASNAAELKRYAPRPVREEESDGQDRRARHSGKKWHGQS